MTGEAADHGPVNRAPAVLVSAPPPPRGVHWKGGGALEAAPEAVRQAVGGGLPKRLGAVTVGYKCH